MVDTKVPTIIFCHDEIEDKGDILGQSDQDTSPF